MKVYFIKPIGAAGPIKIGCSGHPGKRKSSLQTWSPLKLELAATYEGGRKDEARFHALFIDDHSHGEWFNASKALTDTIERVKSGKFTDADLPRYAGRLKGLRHRLEIFTEIDFDYAEAMADYWALHYETRWSVRHQPIEPSAFAKIKTPSKKRERLERLQAALAPHIKKAA